MEDVGSMLPAVTQVAQEVNKAGERLLDLMRSEHGLAGAADSGRAGQTKSPPDAIVWCG
jgi:hypothetical protein